MKNRAERNTFVFEIFAQGRGEVDNTRLMLKPIYELKETFK